MLMLTACGGTSSGGGYFTDSSDTTSVSSTTPAEVPSSSDDSYVSDDSDSYSSDDESGDSYDGSDDSYVSDDSDESDDSDDSYSSSDDSSEYSEEVSGPAPYGTSSAAVWWTPAEDEFSQENLWQFEPVSGSGWRQSYQPTGIDGPVQFKHLFGYETGSDSSEVLITDTESGGTRTLSILDYDSSSDVLHVNWSGFEQYWYGCSSGRLPAYAVAVC